MKKRLLILTAAVVLVILLAFIRPTEPKPAKFSVGAPLPPGKVTPQLVSTWDTAVLLAPDGSLWAWGGVKFQLRGLFGSPTVTATPVRVGSDSDWRGVATSGEHTLALKSDGSLWGWGYNSSGRLAQPNPKTHLTKPTRIGTETNWIQISAGAGHSLGLKSDGSVWAWGQNEHGQVGDGTRSNQFTVTRIGADNDWQYVAAGAFNSYALKRNGTVWGWGLDPITSGSKDSLSPAQIDPGTNWVSISASDYSLLALKSDGTLWIYGQNASSSAPQYVKQSASAFVQIGTDQDWQSVCAGSGFFYARKRDGSWWICGQNEDGQLAQGHTSPFNVAAPRRLGFDFEPWAFAAGLGNCVLLTKDGALWTWGERIGATSQPRAFERLKEQWNQFISRLLKRGYSWSGPRPKTDSVPFKIWELPVDMRRSLAGNAASTNQSATNAAHVKE